MSLKEILTTCVVVLMIVFVYYMVDAQRRQSEKKLKEMRKNLKVGDTIDGINIVINVKGKDLLEIQNRSQHINIWMKRHEIPVPGEIERQISDLQKPLQKERVKCRE